MDEMVSSTSLVISEREEMSALMAKNLGGEVALGGLEAEEIWRTVGQWQHRGQRSQR